MTNTRFDLLPYSFQADALRAYEAAGHVVYICKDRNGSRKISLDGGRRLTVFEAMRKMDAWLERQRGLQAYVSEGLGENIDFCPSDNS